MSYQALDEIILEVVKKAIGVEVKTTRDADGDLRVEVEIRLNGEIVASDWNWVKL